MENKNKRTILVFNHTLAGHRVEFFHHLYLAAMNMTSNKYIFSYPKCDEEQIKYLEWPHADNIVFKETDLITAGCNVLQSSYRSYVALKMAIKETNPDEVVLMDVMIFMPFACLLRGVLIKGLIGTGIYLYTWKEDGLKKRIENVLKYFLFAKCKVFSKVYIQCDLSSALYLNKKFKTSKFEYICDPVSRLSISAKNLREELGISSEKIVVLHAGELSNRKGSLDLLTGINLCTPKTLAKYYFIFAGNVKSVVKSDFFKLVSDIKQKTDDFLLIEGFVSFEHLASLVSTCDILFLPYNLTNQSSGFVGYGAEFNKPVVVTRDGLLGKIVRKYKLGYIIPDNTPKTISEFLSANKRGMEINGQAYLSDNTVKEFADMMI